MQNSKVKRQNHNLKVKSFKFLLVVLTFSFLLLNWWLPSIYVAPVLMYHNIDRNSDILSVSPENFERQMKFLKNAKYNVIALEELVRILVYNKKIPPRTVIITFDDGRDNNFTNAYPVLKRYNIPATMFVIPGHCGEAGYLNKQQIKVMAESGIEIASHTLNDVWLPGLSEAKLTEELAGSKKAIKEITGKEARFISYPLGGFDERVRLAVMRAGFKAACATNPGRYRADNDIYALKRIKVSGKDSGNLVKFWFYTSGYAVWSKELKREKK